MNHAATTGTKASNNPLLEPAGLPRFEAITPEHVLPAVKTVIAESMELLEQVEGKPEPTWEGVVAPLDEIGRKFERSWGPVSHLFGVANSSELREAYEAAQPEIVEFSLRAKQSVPVYQALKQLRDGAEWGKLDGAQQRIIEQKLLDAELAGIALTGDKQKRFNEIARDLSQLGTKFSNNVLDATKAYSLTIIDPADAEGLPLSLRRLAAQSYNQKKSEGDAEATPENGPWRITLDQPSFGPFLQH